MKTIGIVDASTIGACLCANEIVLYSQTLLPPDEHPEFIMHALSFHNYKTAMYAKDWKLMGEHLLKSIKTLHQAGADFIIIPSNTPHFSYDYVQARSPLPVLNLIEISAKACAGIKRVAVLGTKFTMQGGLYDTALQSQGIENVKLPENLIEAIHNLIVDEIIPNKVQQSSVDQLCDALLQLECDGFILGCTELPEVFNHSNLPNRKLIDTTRLLAQEAVTHALS